MWTHHVEDVLILPATGLKCGWSAVALVFLKLSNFVSSLEEEKGECRMADYSSHFCQGSQHICVCTDVMDLKMSMNSSPSCLSLLDKDVGCS